MAARGLPGTSRWFSRPRHERPGWHPLPTALNLARRGLGLGQKSTGPPVPKHRGSGSDEQVSSLSPVAGRRGLLPGVWAVAGTLAPCFVFSRADPGLGFDHRSGFFPQPGLAPVDHLRTLHGVSGARSEAVSAVPRTGKSNGMSAWPRLSRANGQSTHNPQASHRQSGSYPQLGTALRTGHAAARSRP